MKKAWVAMKDKVLIAIIILLMLILYIFSPVASIAQEQPITAIKMKTLAWQDDRVYGDSWVDGKYADGEYIDNRSPICVWTITEPIAIVGSKVYIEVHPIWRPTYHKGNLECEVELAKITNAPPQRTINKVDMKLVIGDVNGDVFQAGEWVKEEVIMFPAGTGVICNPGDQIAIIPDGKNLLMNHENAVVMYFRAYIFYVEL